jgi:hypothetical protein
LPIWHCADDDEEEEDDDEDDDEEEEEEEEEETDSSYYEDEDEEDEFEEGTEDASYDSRQAGNAQNGASKFHIHSKVHRLNSNIGNELGEEFHECTPAINGMLIGVRWSCEQALPPELPIIWRTRARASTMRLTRKKLVLRMRKSPQVGDPAPVVAFVSALTASVVRRYP